MTPLGIGVLGIAAMFGTMLLGMPVAFSMLLTGFLGIVYLINLDAALHLLASNIWEQFSSYGLTVIPLFVLMGQFAYRSGATERLYFAAYKWIGQHPGGLAGTTVLAAMGFSAICGSNSATTATMATVALPEMRKYRYDPALSTGSVAIGGTLGVVIPPSVVLIVIAVQTEQSVITLFMASLVPGVLLTMLFLITVFVLCARNPVLGPPGPSTTWEERWRALGGIGDAVALFALVLGGLYLGWFTPSEAGAAGAFGALAMGLARRRLRWTGLTEAVHATLRIAAMVVLLITGAVVFSRFLTITRLPFVLAEWVVALPVTPQVVLVVLLAVYIIGGCLMDALGFLVATLPIFFPLAVALQIDPVWFTVILTLATSMGAITPPVGVNVYIVSGMAPDVPIQTIFRGVAVFLLAYLVCLAALFLLPELALSLPRSLGLL